MLRDVIAQAAKEKKQITTPSPTYMCLHYTHQQKNIHGTGQTNTHKRADQNGLALTRPCSISAFSIDQDARQ